MPGLDPRPTSDRLRETLFDVLCAGNPGALEDSIWIDLYAGTGAVGIEAISRGASMVHFVEKSKAASALVQSNLQSLDVVSGYTVSQRETASALRALETQGVQADFIFLDPPYRLEREYAAVLEALASSSLLKSSGEVIAEHSKKFDPRAEYGRLRRVRTLKQGDAALSFYRWKP